MKNKEKEGIIGVLLFFVLFLLVVDLSIGDPPIQRTVKGTVYQKDESSQVESGLIVYVNNTNLSIIETTQTYGPPVFPGIYSATINSTPNDLIYVWAMNETDWGYNYGVMEQTQVEIDLNLNISRDPELSVLILFPENNTEFNSSQTINITANITVFRGSGTDCNAMLSFLNPNIFTLSTGETYTHYFGDLDWMETVTTTWDIDYGYDGITNITVSAECSNSDLVFEFLGQDNAEAVNISNIDISPPVILINLPSNNSRRNNPVLFEYNVSDGSGVMNCSLFLNGLLTNTTFYPEKDKMINFSYSLIQKNNQWYINCTDNSSRKNTGTSGVFNLTLNDYPYLSNLVIEDPFDLYAGSNRTLFCNGTVTDLDGYQDIAKVNASLFLTGYSAESEYNRTNSYKNSSCTLYNGAGNNLNFDCSFSVEYYASNGTWTCNATAFDSLDGKNSSEIDTEFNELLAFGISPSIIDFTNLEIMQISPSDVPIEITNYGNTELDLSLYAYYQYENDNISMDCEKGNISYSYEKFSIFPGQNFNMMTPVNNTLNQVFVDFNLEKMVYGASETKKKELYWKLQIPLRTGGVCNGKVVFWALNS